MQNKITFEVFGAYALFSDPITRVGGEKTSYHIPTYQALKGIVDSIYWKPTLVWVIDRVRVMNPIQTESKAIKTLKYTPQKKEGVITYNDLSYYTYLKDVKYQVEAHFEWNKVRDDLVADRNEDKHFQIATRLLSRGGKRPIFLGTSECGGYVLPCAFGEGVGAYDTIKELGFGTMFHGFDYPSETGKAELYTRLWHPVMRNGVVKFISPSDCKLKRYIREMPVILPKTMGVEHEFALYSEVDYELAK